MLYPDQFQRANIASIRFEAERDNFPGAFHQGVQVFVLRVATRQPWDGSDVKTFFVTLDDHREFALGFHKAILSSGGMEVTKVSLARL